MTAGALARAECVDRSRELLGTELAALVGESYERAYGDMVRVQQLTELEETVDYSLALTLAQGAPPPRLCGDLVSAHRAEGRPLTNPLCSRKARHRRDSHAVTGQQCWVTTSLCLP